jgi:molybdate transport system permease protein
MKGRGSWGGRGLGLTLGSSVLIVFLALPILALLLSLPPRALLAQLRSEIAIRALVLTMETTLLATAISVSAGMPLAFLLARKRFPGREVLDTLIDLPITIPPVVGGVALLLAFGRRGLLGGSFEALGVAIPFTSAAVVMAQVFVASPFFVKAARAGFESVPQRLESAARTLGESQWRTFWSVTLPLARPSLLAGTVLCWARALSEFGATMMFAGNFPGRTQTLSLAVMSAMESDLETALAVSALSLFLGVVALVLAKVWARRALRFADAG